MKNTLIELCGWYGTIAIIGAYFLNSFSFLETTSSWYQILNITGALGIVLLSWKKQAYQPMILNIVWTVIALVALAQIVV